MRTIASRLALLGGLLLLTTACGTDLVEPTIGAGCSQGTLVPGQVIEGRLTEHSCRFDYFFWNGYTQPYESWTVQLTQGRAYMFYMAPVPDAKAEGLNEVDPMLALYGKDGQGNSIPLALSDDDGDGASGYNSEFWFVAPRSGSFQVLAMAYDWDEFGGYRLEMQECPVLGRLKGAGTYTFPLPSSPCIRHNAPDGVSTYSFLSVAADSFEAITVGIDNDRADAEYEMFGPGFDTYANIYNESSSDSYSQNGGSATVFMSDIPGLVSIGVGSTEFDQPGTLTVTLGRAFNAPPPPASLSPGRLTFRTTHPPKRR